MQRTESFNEDAQLSIRGANKQGLDTVLVSSAALGGLPAPPPSLAQTDVGRGGSQGLFIVLSLQEEVSSPPPKRLSVLSA